MSWFKRKPRLKEPLKHVPHHRTSPVTDRLMEEAKKTGLPKKDKKKEVE